MSHKNSHSRRMLRIERVNQWKKSYGEITPNLQLKRVDDRNGKGVGAVRERRNLDRLINELDLGNKPYKEIWDMSKNKGKNAGI